MLGIEEQEIPKKYRSERYFDHFKYLSILAARSTKTDQNSSTFSISWLQFIYHLLPSKEFLSIITTNAGTVCCFQTLFPMVILSPLCQEMECHKVIFWYHWWYLFYRKQTWCEFTELLYKSFDWKQTPDLLPPFFLYPFPDVWMLPSERYVLLHSYLCIPYCFLIFILLPNVCLQEIVSSRYILDTSPFSSSFKFWSSKFTSSSISS